MAQAITFDDVLNFKDNIMISEQNRLASFKKWPFKSGKCTKRNLVRAGFYKCNTKDEVDSVRCFVCFETLSGWKENDEPFAEHLKLSPSCLFAKLNLPQGNLLIIDWLNIIKERSIKLQKLRLEKLEAPLLNEI